MTMKEKAGMRLLAIQDAITAAEEGIRILKSEEHTAKRDVRQAEEQSSDARLAEASAHYDALLERVPDMPTNQPSVDPVHAEQPVLKDVVRLLEQVRCVVHDCNRDCIRKAKVEPVLSTETITQPMHIATGGLTEVIRLLNVYARKAAETIADQPTPPPVEVEMRVIHPTKHEWGWECRLGPHWLTIPDRYGAFWTTAGGAQKGANFWLAARSEQLGIKLVAKWDDDEPGVKPGSGET